MGINTCITKPIRQSDLLDAIMSALGSRRQPVHLSISPKEVRPARALDLLLVEDNPVNQRLALRILEKWGHRVAIAHNGRQAVDTWLQHQFDLVIMDVQMPVMSGLEAVALIRTHEAGTDRHTPVIAMTAHAMDSDRRKCLESGMDDYVTKPIDVARLFEAIERLAGPAKTESPPPPAPARAQPLAAKADLVPAPSTTSPPEFDLAFALKRVDGDHALLREVTGLFLEDAPKLLQQIRDAIEHRDARLLEHAAHTLKGAVGNFGARPTQELALELEKAGRSGQFDDAPALLNQLEGQFARLNPALEALAKEAA